MKSMMQLNSCVVVSRPTLTVCNQAITRFDPGDGEPRSMSEMAIFHQLHCVNAV
jgi:hypothetical protein